MKGSGLSFFLINYFYSGGGLLLVAGGSLRNIFFWEGESECG